MANFQPRVIIGRWRQGYALDLHTLSSVFIGNNEFGHPEFETTRSDIGELLFKLKNRADTSTVNEIVAAVAELMGEWKPELDVIVPVPPSTLRVVQPVLLLAEAIGTELGISVANCVRRLHEIAQLKNVYDLDKRLELLSGLHEVEESATRQKRVLLFDDLYRSGATMNAIAIELYDRRKASDVLALTITRTRSNQ